MKAKGAIKGSSAAHRVNTFLFLWETYKDHNAVDAEIEGNCGTDILWTLPLPVGLGDAGVKPMKTFGHTETGAGMSITLEGCAIWMVDVAVGNMVD